MSPANGWRLAILAVLTVIGFSIGSSCVGDDGCSKYRDDVAKAATMYEYAGYDSVTAISLAENDVFNPGKC